MSNQDQHNKSSPCVPAGREVQSETPRIILSDVLAQMMDAFTPHACQKGLKLACGISSETPAVLEGDGSRLRQVLVNLLDNAIKYTQHGEVSVVVDAAPWSEDGSEIMLHVTVRDTGPGIPLERMEFVFNTITQPAGSDGPHDTGTNLANSKQLVDLMGGRIWAESTVDVGSAFHVMIPFPVASQQHEP